MEPVTTALIATALGYILKGITQSKTVETASEELLTGYWHWIRPLFLKDEPELEKQLQQKPDEVQTQQKALDKLEALSQDPAFAATLRNKVAELKKAGIKEKNVLVGNLEGVKGSAHVGDKSVSPSENYDRKNIIEGNVKDIGGDFHLGDG